MIDNHLIPAFGRLALRELTPGTLQGYFANRAGGAQFPTLLKIRDTLSSILRSAIHGGFLTKNPMDGLELPPDKRPRRRKPTISPEQFHSLMELIPEPYATAVFVCVWTGLRVSELLALKWRCIHSDAITIEERYCRGDWAAPKTDESAAPIAVEPDVIARIHRLKTLTIQIRAGLAIRKYRAVKASGPDDLGFPVTQGWKANAGWQCPAAIHQTRKAEAGDRSGELAGAAEILLYLDDRGWSRSEISPAANEAHAKLDNHGCLLSGAPGGAASRGRTAFAVREKLCPKVCPTAGPIGRASLRAGIDETAT